MLLVMSLTLNPMFSIVVIESHSIYVLYQTGGSEVYFAKESVAG